MKCYLAKTGEIKQRHILVDASTAPVGRLAVKIANALRGKDKPTYTPHVDTGDYVIVINASKAVLTGKKGVDNTYQDYSGWKGGLKISSVTTVRERNPERLIKDAVWGMLPHGRLGRQLFRKLRVYPGAEHPHEAQQPVEVSFS